MTRPKPKSSKKKQHANCPKLTIYDPRGVKEGECYCMFMKFKGQYRNSREVNINYTPPPGHIAEECPCIEKNRKLRIKYLKKYQPQSTNIDPSSQNDISETSTSSNTEMLTTVNFDNANYFDLNGSDNYGGPDCDFGDWKYPMEQDPPQQPQQPEQQLQQQKQQ